VVQLSHILQEKKTSKPFRCFNCFLAANDNKLLWVKPFIYVQEVQCCDFVTSLFCHLCANCQEYGRFVKGLVNHNPPDLTLAVVTAPMLQTMESGNTE